MICKMVIKELLEFPDNWVDKSKLHLAIGVKDRFRPLHVYFMNQFKEWQENQNNKNFELDYIFSLIYYARHEWLFAGIYKRVGIEKIGTRYAYKTELLDVGKEYIGRLIVGFEKKFRASYPYLKNHIEHLSLIEILREPYSITPFPGFQNVLIDFDLLKSIITQEEKTWKTALSSVKGIYLITDKSNGKSYVGSGYGTESIWNRWGEYAKTRHGGNKKLKDLLAIQGLDYSHNFQFSVLETRNINTDKDEIIKRENFWKEVLLTRKYGYNRN